MEQNITLEIKASDINETWYSDSKDCAITRALHRAGFPDLRDSGKYILNDEDRKVTKPEDKDYYELGNRVIRMYHYNINKKFPENPYPTVEEPTDFSVTLTLNFPEEEAK